MDGLSLIRHAQSAGLAVAVSGDKIVIRGPKRAEPVARLLIANKPAVIAALSGDRTDDFDERAAIVEHDGGLPHGEAEIAAKRSGAVACPLPAAGWRVIYRERLAYWGAPAVSSVSNATPRPKRSGSPLPR